MVKIAYFLKVVRNQRSERPIFTRSDLRSFFAYISLPNISGNTTSSFHLSNADYIELFTWYTSLMKNSLKRLGSIRNLQSKTLRFFSSAFLSLPFHTSDSLKKPKKTKKPKKPKIWGKCLAPYSLLIFGFFVFFVFFGFFCFFWFFLVFFGFGSNMASRPPKNSTQWLVQETQLFFAVPRLIFQNLFPILLTSTPLCFCACVW